MLEGHLPKGRFTEPGERVVQGQRLMQAASDLYLGCTKGVEANRHLYWRQLRAMKGSDLVETMTRSSSPSMPASAAGPWPARANPGREMPSNWLHSWARATSSTDRSPTSPNATPTRTNETTERLRRRSGLDGWKPSRVSELGRIALVSARRAAP